MLTGNDGNKSTPPLTANTLVNDQAGQLAISLLLLLLVSVKSRTLSQTTNPFVRQYKSLIRAKGLSETPSLSMTYHDVKPLPRQDLLV